jgi:energy-coupling factor transporter ATP-binding protein EcfA2
MTENSASAANQTETADPSSAPVMIRNPSGQNFPDRRRYRSELPKPPQTVEETGLDFLFLVDLLCKVLFLKGQMRTSDLLAHTRLSLGVLKPLLDFMRTERMCEMTSHSIAEATSIYNLSETGRQRAEDALRRSRYAGPAPVTLAVYNETVRQQSVLGMRVGKEDITNAFEGVMIRQELLDQFGAAMNSGRAIFVHGPAGSGKTFIAEHLANVLSGNILAPYAILVDSDIIEVFDPLIHKPIRPDAALTPTSTLDNSGRFDARWELCQRPVVLAGGELTLSMLDLEFDDKTRFYHAPPQVKANNGLLIIDDLGRQIVPAQQLMNRWIVPLDRRMDHLALHTGVKFVIPFDVIVVFSSNMSPSNLADEAFLRRLGYKIHIGELSEHEYTTVFRSACESLGISYTESGLRFILDTHRQHGKPLLACSPRDLLGQVSDYARYQDRTPELSEDMLTWAWNNYYAVD